MIRRASIGAVAVMLAAFSAGAQHLWTEAEFKAKIVAGLSADVSASYRTSDGLKSTDDWRFAVGADYKLLPWLKVGASYTFIEQRVGDGYTRKGNFVPAYWQPKSRGSLSLTGSWKAGRFSFSLRERYQYTHRYWHYVEKYSPAGDRVADEYVSPGHSHLLRSKVEVEYNIRKCPLTPYVSFEIYNSLNEGFAVDKMRYSAGVDCKINRHNTIGLYYLYNDRSDDDSRGGNVIGISYKFKL